MAMKAILSELLLEEVLEWIFKVIFVILNWIFEIFVQIFASWIAKLFYKMLIWAPLQIVNCLMAIFKFFSRGLSSVIFNTTYNKDGSINYQFSLTSQLGYIILFVFIVALMMFFINFLLSFSQLNNTVDSKGLPQTAPVRKFVYLRWPLIMVVSLLLGPVVIVIADQLMGYLVDRVDGSNYKAGFTYDEIAHVHTLTNTGLNIKHVLLTRINSNWAQTYNELALLKGYIAILSEASASINSMSYADKTEIYNILSINDVFANLSATSKTDRLNLVIGDALSRYDEIVKYLNSKLTNDMQTFSSIASGFHIDQYIDASSAAALRTVITSVTDFKTNVDGLYKSLTTLNGNGSLVNSGIDNVNVLYAHNDLITRVAMGVGLSTDFVSRNNSFLSIMHRLSTYQHASLVNIRSLINNVAKDYEIESPVYFIIGQSNRSSSIYLILYGDNTLPGMVTYLNKTPAVNININTVGLLYQAITGDPNPSNWTNDAGADYIANANFLSWVIGTAALFGMIHIVYTYCVAAIKRAFYLISYWIMGFFYFANGINNKQAVSKWAKMFFGKWWCIFLLFMLFDLNSIIFSLMRPFIYSELANRGDAFNYGGIDILPNIGMMFMLEAGYQVSYQIWNKYEGSFGAGEEALNIQKSHTFTEGKAAYVNAKEYAEKIGYAPKEAYDFTKGMVTKEHETADYWRRKKDDRMADEKNSLDEVRRKTTGTAIGLAGAGGTGVGKKAGQPQTREESNNDPNTGTNAQRKGSLGSPSTVFGGMAAAGALGGAGNSNLFNRNAAVAADMNRDNAGGQTSGQIGRNNDAPSGVSDAALGGPENNNKSNNPLANRRKVGSPTGGN